MSSPSRSATRTSTLIGLIGHGVGPSLTPAMHESEGRRHGMNYVYRPVELGAQGDARTLGDLFHAARLFGFTGLNITHPVKQTVVPLLDALSPAAAAVGAVNTVVFDPDQGAVGHNTDVTGYRASLDDALDGAACGEVVLVGAGGAGSAVAHGLAERGVSALTIIDVDHARAEQLAQDVRQSAGSEIAAASAHDVGVHLRGADGVVNATPFGMAHHPGTAFDPDLLRDDMWVSDIVYRPVETELIRCARARGCRVITGLGMAMHQAADAFEIFTGEQADRHAMLNDLRRLVEAESTPERARGH